MASTAVLIEQVRAVLGNDILVSCIAEALRFSDNNPDLAVNMILDNPAKFMITRSPVKLEPMETTTASPPPNKAETLLPSVKEEKDGFVSEINRILETDVGCAKREPMDAVKEEKVGKKYDICWAEVKSRFDREYPIPSVKHEKMDPMEEDYKPPAFSAVKEETHPPTHKMGISDSDEEFFSSLAETRIGGPYINPRPIRSFRPPGAVDPRGAGSRAVALLPKVPGVEDGAFPEEPDWFLVGRTNVNGLSTTRGKGKLLCDEIVHFTFPANYVQNQRKKWVSAKVAVATAEIVRFSTKRSGEIGRLPPEWSKCLVPLVNSTKVKVRGRCVIPPPELSLMQDIVLYISFYIHESIFTEGDKSSWKLVAPSHIDTTVHPLPTLFKLLKLKPTRKAEFTPEELDSRKRNLSLEDDDGDGAALPALAKRQRANQMYTEQGKDEQALSESALNKLVGTAEVYDLEEADSPAALQCTLRPYQKQALHWMSELERGIDMEKASKTLHPCWEEYHIADKRASAVYINAFSGEATTEFPSAMQMARGGILADAMGLGKTVMTIALILGKMRAAAGDQDMTIKKNSGNREDERKRPKIRAGTLIVCPMALLGQWKDELETHSQQGSISVFVHYGGDRTSDTRVISEPDVVLTTYGVLGSSYATEHESIFHQVEWYRVVLDEAHTIKSSKCRVSQAAFALASHCRWCLTGTPLQNSLEDLYSLLCFLHVEPWCNWAWWNKLIQKPYENGDERGLRLVKAILRPLMLRRTKDTKDKDGNAILVLPPAHVQVIECQQSEAERDFYDALFSKSKVRFDQFVAQGKVLHNYASILELLLRLRQCCNHPFLVMSRGDSDLNKLARRFAGETSQAYADEVVEGLRRGEVAECPICLESASDDPVLTPCMHRMCRECLLSSWRSPAHGPCPICRRPLTKKDLAACLGEGQGRFWVDVKGNWKESSKVERLMECLERLRSSGTGEKSIVFSQWTSFLDLLEVPLIKEGYRFLRFDGKLSQKNREKVLHEFTDNSDVEILLMSLKAGGVGLNLTAASNVFLMDPWWNPAVEEQAIMRIHRIGQKRQVRVRRFIVKDTVEERMQQVQARKQRMISGALTDEEVRTARIEELKMLFR